MADRSKVPIDIQYKKLLEALVDRRIVPQKWMDQQKQIRDGIALLYPTLPLESEKLVKFRSAKPNYEDLHYFDCKFILESLVETEEGGKKNFFGQYTSPVVKQWNALVRLYEKNNVFAAEAARIIAQNTAYEIPFLKKLMQQNEKQVADNKRKIGDLTKSIAEYKRQLENSCASMGIQGVHFREELQRLPYELPAIFDQIAKTICSDSIDAVIAYHAALQDYLHSCNDPNATPGASTLSKKDKMKNVTVDSESMASVDDNIINVPAAPPTFFTAIRELRAANDGGVEASTPTLDFEAEAAEISWDITMDAADEGAIDWGIETLSSDPSGTVDQSDADMDAPVKIDWDITSSDVVEPFVNESGTLGDDLIVTEASGLTSSGINSTSRVGLLSEGEFRARVLNDLLELRAFLGQRRIELSGNDGHVAFANQFQGASVLLKQQSVEFIENYEIAVNQTIELITNKRLQQLVLIKTSDRYLDRQVATLEMMTTQMDKCSREIKLLKDKNVDLIDATAEYQPQIDALVTTTKKLKKELERTLPVLFKGYKVNIIGEVNSL